MVKSHFRFQVCNKSSGMRHCVQVMSISINWHHLGRVGANQKHMQLVVFHHKGPLKNDVCTVFLYVFIYVFSFDKNMYLSFRDLISSGTQSDINYR